MLLFAMHNNSTNEAQSCNPLAIPETILIFPGYKRAIWIAIVIGMILWGAVIFIWFPPEARWYTNRLLHFYIGLGAVFAVAALPGSMRLLVTRDGLSVRFFFVDRFYPWNNIQCFTVGYHRGNPVVFIEVVPGTEPRDVLAILGGIMMPGPPRISGAYSKSPEQLADLLNTCKLYYRLLDDDDLDPESEPPFDEALSKILRYSDDSTRICVIGTDGRNIKPV